jgi:GTP-binding protein
MKNIRNIAIIAHVDHGKTTLVDCLLQDSGTFRDNEEVSERALDSNDLEKERGITILAKTTGINYQDSRINILDTPGHADFAGEVERIMNMVDGCLLVVDAFEGTMPQTRFVLKQALLSHIKPIVVINKIDRPFANPVKAVNEVIDLFIELGAEVEDLDFPVVYVSALRNTSSLDADLSTQQPGMDVLFKTIIEVIPAPSVEIEGGLQLQPALLDYNDYVGRIGIGRIKQGTIKVNETVSCVRVDGSIKNFRVQKLFGFLGLKRVEINEASAGEIVAVAGLNDINVGETICSLDTIIPLPLLHISEPTLQMTFGTNTSPFAGKEGKHLTARKIEERLFKEIQKDVSLRVKRIENSESWIVSGRGELHLSILIENMRREGFELQVSKPEVIVKEIDGVQHEPYEELQIETPDEYLGGVMETIGPRGANLISMHSNNGQTRVIYDIPTRGLIGFSTDFLTITKGYGIINHTFKDYRVLQKASYGERQNGALVSMDNGQATPYALNYIEDRGVLFIEPGIDVYEGMIVGENAYQTDLAVNPVKEKHLTNMRAAGKDHTSVLKRPKKFSLETALDYLNTDELLEVTPKGFRMRKKILHTEERKKSEFRSKN